MQLLPLAAHYHVSWHYVLTLERNSLPQTHNNLFLKRASIFSEKSIECRSQPFLSVGPRTCCFYRSSGFGLRFLTLNYILTIKISGSLTSTPVMDTYQRCIVPAHQLHYLRDHLKTFFFTPSLSLVDNNLSVANLYLFGIIHMYGGVEAGFAKLLTMDTWSRVRSFIP